MTSISRLTFAVLTIIFISLLVYDFFAQGHLGNVQTTSRSQFIGELENRILDEIHLGDTANFDKIYSDIDKLLSIAPLDDRALFLYISASHLNQRDSFDPSIFDVIMDRNPRNRSNLYLLLGHSLRTSNLTRSLEVIDLLYKIETDKRMPLLKVINAIYEADSVNQSFVIDDFLKQRPSWEQHFVYSQAQNLDSHNLQRFTETMKKSIDLSEDVSIRVKPIRLVLYALIENRQYNEAFEVWSSATERLEAQDPNLVLKRFNSVNYNPRFFDIKSPAPFNWEYLPSKNSFVNLETDGLYASVAGPLPRVLARQYFVPPKGGWRLEVQANYDYPDTKGSFKVIAKCLSPQFNAVEVLLNQSNQKATTIVKEFDGKSTDCSIASLELIGEPRALGQRVSIIIKSISIKPLKQN